MDDSNLAWRVLGLGAIAGVRSMAAPATLSKAVERGDVGNLEHTPFATLGSPRVSTALRALEIGEMFVDKLPVAPSRTSPPPLLGRAASGGLVGAALFASGGRGMAAGGVLGAVSALTVAYAAEYLRLQIAERLGIPDPAVALLEDGVVLFGAARLLR